MKDRASLALPIFYWQQRELGSFPGELASDVKRVKMGKLSYPHIPWPFGPIEDTTLVFDMSPRICALVAFCGKDIENRAVTVWPHQAEDVDSDRSFIALIRSGGQLIKAGGLVVTESFHHLTARFGTCMKDLPSCAMSSIVMVAKIKFCQELVLNSPFSIVSGALNEGEVPHFRHWSFEAVAVLDEPVQCESNAGSGTACSLRRHILSGKRPDSGVVDGISIMSKVNAQLAYCKFQYAKQFPRHEYDGQNLALCISAPALESLRGARLKKVKAKEDRLVEAARKRADQ